MVIHFRLIFFNQIFSSNNEQRTLVWIYIFECWIKKICSQLPFLWDRITAEFNLGICLNCREQKLVATQNCIEILEDHNPSVLGKTRDRPHLGSVFVSRSRIKNISVRLKVIHLEPLRDINEPLLRQFETHRDFSTLVCLTF
jgi:hypothetical protein